VIDVETLLDKIKTIENLKTDKEVAEKALEMRSDALVQRKNRNSVPHDHVIRYCMKNKISIDMIYDNSGVIVDNIHNPHKPDPVGKDTLSAIKLFDASEHIKLPIDNKNGMLNAYIDNSRRLVFIIDRNFGGKIQDGLNLIRYEDRVYVKNVISTFSGTFKIRPYEAESRTVDSEVFEISKDDMDNVEFIGRVIKIVSIDDVI
jgi:hypothetical protein